MQGKLPLIVSRDIKRRSEIIDLESALSDAEKEAEFQKRNFTHVRGLPVENDVVRDGIGGQRRYYYMTDSFVSHFPG